MKLFIWTEQAWDGCNHHMVFAEDQESAKMLLLTRLTAGLMAGIVIGWDEFQIWRAEAEIKEIRNPYDAEEDRYKWTIAAYEVALGVAEPLEQD